MIPESLVPFSYLLRSSVWEVEKRQTPMGTYLLDKKLAILFKISASLFDSRLSSNPGVSIRVTVRPSRGNSFESSTSIVAESKVVPTRSSEPLARLMNWSPQCEFGVYYRTHMAHLGFTTSSWSHDSIATIRMSFQQESGSWLRTRS